MADPAGTKNRRRNIRNLGICFYMLVGRVRTLSAPARRQALTEEPP